MSNRPPSPRPCRPRGLVLVAVQTLVALAAACAESPTGPRPADPRHARAGDVAPRRTAPVDVPLDSATGGPVCETITPESLLVDVFARGVLLTPPEIEALRTLRTLRDSAFARARALGLDSAALRATSDAELLARLGYAPADAEAILVKYAAARTALAPRAATIAVPRSRRIDADAPGNGSADAPRGAVSSAAGAGAGCDARALLACSVGCARGPYYMFLVCEMKCIWDSCDTILWW